MAKNTKQDEYGTVHKHVNGMYIIPVCDCLLCVLCEDDFVCVYFCVNCLFAVYLEGLMSFL